jgi:hypothetical protein
MPAEVENKMPAMGKIENKPAPGRLRKPYSSGSVVNSSG